MLAYLVVNNSFVSVEYTEDISDMKYQLCHLNSEEYFIQQNMIRISNIYVSIHMYILKFLYICWVRENVQHSMLSKPDYKNISIDKYYQVILQTFMLSLCVFVTRSLILVYLKVISNIQC